jgi:hypothetical protein
VTIIPPQLTKGLVNQQKRDSANLSQQKEHTREKDQKLWGSLEEQDQWWLSPADDLAPSWKPQHPTEEEQKAIQWNLQGKAQEIASRQQSLMDWLTPLYVAKVPVAMVARPIAEQKSPIVKQKHPTMVANKPLAEQKSLVVMEDNLVAEEEGPTAAEEGTAIVEEGPTIAEVVELQSLAIMEEGPVAIVESPTADTKGPAQVELV